MSRLIEFIENRFIIFLAYLFRFSDELILFFINISEGAFQLFQHIFCNSLELLVLVVSVFILGQNDQLLS